MNLSFSRRDISIDEEIERILREAYEEAQGIIQGERPAMERLKDGLMLYETLDTDEIQRLIESQPVHEAQG